MIKASSSNKKIVQKIILAGVVVKDDKVLIVQRSSNDETYPNLWELPSGKRGPLEPSEKALLREVYEEVGLDVEIIMPISVFDFQVEKDTEIRDATQISFLVKPKGEQEVKLSSEHQNFAWITKEEVDNYEISEETKKVILRAFSGLKFFIL